MPWHRRGRADALELNVYYLPTDPSQDGAFVEKMVLDVLEK